MGADCYGQHLTFERGNANPAQTYRRNKPDGLTLDTGVDEDHNRAVGRFLIWNLGLQRVFDGLSIIKRDEIMKAVLSLLYLIPAITLVESLQTANSASPATPRARTFLEEVNAYKTDTTLFTPVAQALTVHGRFGDYTIDTFRLTKCQPMTLSNVVAKLKRFDSDVEIPRIWKIFYDSCAEIIGTNDKGDIYIPNTSGPVSITFDLEKNFKKTKWKPKGEDSVFVGKGSPSAIAPPVAATPLPCGGGKVNRTDSVISFIMNCTPSASTVYYAYALHLDQIGSDNIGVDIGIDPQIINRPP